MSKVRIPIVHEGSLVQFGYHLNYSAPDRKKALLQASKVYSRSELIHKLTTLAVFFKNKYPSKAQKVHKDIAFVRNL